MFNLDNLLEADRRPAPYEPGAELWNDVHISKMMLMAHLSPDTDAASYMPSKMRAICGFLPREMGLTEGCKVIDLGCGPGLYCEILAGQGLAMTGLDSSENSVRYATEHCKGAGTHYVCQSYLSPFGEGEYDASLMISEDYGVLSPENRRLLLKNIHTALRPRGYFAFDVPSLAAFEARKAGAAQKWYAVDGEGFWRPHPHFVFEKTLFYPEIPALCDLYAVFDHEVKITRVWQTFFSGQSIRTELEDAGFKVESLYANLWGGEYGEDSATVGVICRKG